MMAKFRILYILLVILVIASVFVDAQQQNRPNKRRKNGGQQQQQQQSRKQQQQKNKKRIPNQAGVKKLPNKLNKVNKNKVDKLPMVNPNSFVTHEIPGLGSVRGRMLKSDWTDQPIMQFFDIPYARSTVRFKPAAPVTEWTGTLKAEKPYYGCPSLQEDWDYDVLESKKINVEDCLRLTISTKSFKNDAPVMVYIHGDFLYDGSILEAPPGYLLEEDVVLVSVRYRLGPFGFLSTMTEDIPGNAAVSDVIMALQWIQEHIANFGGDPERVTLFGQVGGSALINVLTMSPAVNDGLFHRVIYHSSSALSPAFITDNPLPAAKEIGKIAGCKNVNKVESLTKCLRRLNTTELLDAFSEHGSAKIGQGVGSTGGAQFVVGGPSGILPQFPAKLLTSGKFKAYPTMGGVPKNAGTFLLKDIYLDTFNDTIVDDKMDAMAYIDTIIAETNGDDPTGAWKKYAEEEVFTEKQLKNGSFYKLIPGLVDLASTIAFKNPILLALQGNAKKMPNSTFLYSFDFDGELNRYTTIADEVGNMPFELGVSLTDDNLYLFPWPRFSRINSNHDIKVAKRMVSLWTSFAAKGKPSAPSMLEWPSMNGDTGPYLKIGKTVTVGDNYIDEFNAAVRETSLGYNLVNDEFFQSLNAEQKEENMDENEEDNAANEESDSNGEARGGNIVLIAHRNKF